MADLLHPGPKWPGALRLGRRETNADNAKPAGAARRNASPRPTGWAQTKLDQVRVVRVSNIRSMMAGHRTAVKPHLDANGSPV